MYFQSDNHVIAPLATEILGSFCLRDKTLAKEYFITIFSLVSQISNFLRFVTFDIYYPKFFSYVFSVGITIFA
jgi:hypothetical protein